MEPTLSNNEQSMREKILQQEFPFDPKAWEAMQGLLDDQDQNPIPPPSAPPSGPQPGPGTNRLWWLLLLLLTAGTGSATLILKNIEIRKSGAGPTETHPLTVSEIKQEHRQTPHVLEENPGQPQTSNLIEASNTGQTADRTESLAAGNNIPQALTGTATSQKTAPKTELTGEDIAPGFFRDQPPLEQQGLSATPESDERTLKADLQPNADKTETGAGRPSDIDPAPVFTPFLPAELLPCISTDTLARPARPDSTIRPVPYQPISESRRERGWIFGANLSTVDYRPLRFSAMPHLGYFWRYRLQPRTTVQGELVLKFVSGYDWRAEFFDMVPGGSTQVILENKRLLYIEVPFVLQRAYAPGQSWQIGLKPALTLPIAPYGSYSSANFGAPRRDYPAHEGIRYLDMGLVLGWEYRFNRRWALDIRYNQGLFDLTVDNFYRQRETHLNSDIQVSLRHFITKKAKQHEPKTLFPAPPAER